jgi:hypothetical protein
MDEGKEETETNKALQNILSLYDPYYSTNILGEKGRRIR